MSTKPPKITANEVFHRLANMTVNLLMSRSELMRGQSLDPPQRNLAKECGWPEGEPSLQIYRELYDRVGIATRAVQVYPEESWAVYPDLYETEEKRKTTFERAWEKFEFEQDPWHYLSRADEQSGIGRYGALLIGLDDGLKLDKPVETINRYGQKVQKNSGKGRNVLYLRPYPEDLIRILEQEEDENNPRYGQPVMYELLQLDPAIQAETLASEDDPEERFKQVTVHWTRMLHVADNRQASEVFGCPRLKPIVDDVLDIRKVKGSSAEMFFKGGFPGISFETLPELAANATLDADSVKAEIEAYSQGLQRYMRLVGMTAKSLAPQVADPSNHIISLLQLICACLKVPLRVFMGSEAGHLASTQDATTWNRRLFGRQSKYINPKLIKPFINRLMLMDVLPEVPSYIIKWRDLNILNDSEKAKVSLQKAQAILQYVTSGASSLFPPKMFLTQVLTFTDPEADAIIESAGGDSKILGKMEKLVQATAGNTPASTGTNPQKRTGSSGRRNSLGKAKKK